MITATDINKNGFYRANKSSLITTSNEYKISFSNNQISTADDSNDFYAILSNKYTCGTDYAVLSQRQNVAAVSSIAFDASILFLALIVTSVITNILIYQQ